MGQVSAAGVPPLVDYEDVSWFRDEPEAARGAAAALGRRIGLGEHRTAELVLAVAELATNMRRHAVDGSLLLRVVRTSVTAGVEVVVVDGGPGIVDVAEALRDGVSSEGTLGIGLGAVRRLADVFDIHSRPGQGTVQLARFWQAAERPRPGAAEPAVGGVTRPISGEQVCGDAWATRTDLADDAQDAREAGGARPQAPEPPPAQAVNDWAALTGIQHRPGTATSALSAATSRRASRAVPVPSAVAGRGPAVLVMLCDGLGHGPMAALAGQSAVQAFRSGTSRLPEQIMEQLHKALRGTRGAAVAVARVEPENGRLLFCGVGNITAALVTRDSRHSLLSQPGIVGHQMHQLRTYEHRLPPFGALVLHSDGLNERWTAQDLAGLLPHAPTVVAAGLLRMAGTRRDDASVVVTKELW
ncbi:ATP-binding protein [Streptomyces sp. IBSBF 2435]|uniref:ATP-binding protein n=1 Tax=Streptomyces sp. IBSBF 2435 TaxID=2903531 RepID=UPI002FDC07DA